MKIITQSFDVVVLGGGLAGFAAAVSAARHGAKTVLVQDRPVLGGNSSSEVRVTPHGAGRHHPYAAETGLMAEALAAERLRCHVQPMENGWTNSQWDLALYDICLRTPNLTLHLNTTLCDVLLSDGARGTDLDPGDEKITKDKGYFERPALNTARRIAAVECRVANAETLLVLEGKQFIDCTGDGLCAHLAGCSWRWGSEAAAEFGELHAPSKANTLTMGSSLQFYCHDAGRPVPFVAPPWAVKIDDPDFFWGRGGRAPTEPRGGYWWLEIGVPYDTIHDNETIRRELTAWTLGVWDWMKNKDAWMKDRCANHVLDWIGQVPGKRESRRILGRHFITENELRLANAFPDEIGYGGWFLDLHTPGGLLAEHAEPAASEGYSAHSLERAKGHVGPYGLPLRILQSRDIDNLGFAGRNVSATKAALGSIRVMLTCGVLGQAIGAAAAIATRRGVGVAELAGDAVAELQDLLLRDGCFLPNVARPVAGDLMQAATLSAGSSARSGVSPTITVAAAERPAKRALNQPSDLAQIIPVAGRRLEAVNLCLSLDWAGPVSVPVVLRRVRSLWNYDQDDGEILARETLKVLPGIARWHRWQVGIDLPADTESGGLLRLEFQMEKPGRLFWEPAEQPIIAAPAYYLLPCRDPARRGERYRRHGESGGSFAFATEPTMPFFEPANVLRAPNRPFTDAGMWRSDPSAGLPQAIEARWSSPRMIGRIELHFPGRLEDEISTRPPLYVDPDIARDYHIEALVAGEWRSLASVTENFQHHRLHSLNEAVPVSALRLTITATNGGASASLATFRAFAEPAGYPDPWDAA